MLPTLILREVETPQVEIPPLGTTDSLSESLLDGAASARGIEVQSGIRFDAIEVTSRDNDWFLTGFAFVGAYFTDIDDATGFRRVQGHYDLTEGKAWIQFLD